MGDRGAHGHAGLGAPTSRKEDFATFADPTLEPLKRSRFKDSPCSWRQGEIVDCLIQILGVYHLQNPVVTPDGCACLPLVAAYLSFMNITIHRVGAVLSANLPDLGQGGPDQGWAGHDRPELYEDHHGHRPCLSVLLRQ